MQRTITSLFAEAAVEFKDRPYVHSKTDQGWRSWSFAEMHERARWFAAWLLQGGFPRGERTAVLAEGGPDWVAFELGTLLAGGVSVPLSVKLMPEELAFRINHSAARYLAVSPNTIEKALAVRHEFDHPVRLVLLDGAEGRSKELLARRGLAPEDAPHFSDWLSAGRADLDAADLERVFSGIGEDDLAAICYTSGTSGDPRGVMLTHRNFWVNCRDSVEMFKVPPEYSSLLILPCDHSFAHTVGLLCALAAGFALHFVDARGGPMGLLRNISNNLLETDPVFIATVPALSGSFMKKIIQGIEERRGPSRLLFRMGIKAGTALKGDGFNRPGAWTRLRSLLPYLLAETLVFRRIRRKFGRRLQFFVGGGAFLDRRQQEFFMALGIPVYQGYGLTEAAPVVSSNTPACHKLGTTGRLAPGVACKIVLPDGKPAGIGEIGEIAVQGENVMKGYYRNDQATRAVLRDGWLHTGDLGCVDEDGFLVVTGREKALLISADGEKYSPEEIEEVILSTARVVHQIMLYNDHRKYTTALVVLDEEAVRKFIKAESISDARHLLQWLAEFVFSYRKDPAYARRFPSNWQPATFFILREPFSETNQLLNSTLKIVRHRIAKTYSSEIEYLYSAEGGLPVNERNIETVRRLFGLGAG